MGAQTNNPDFWLNVQSGEIEKTLIEMVNLSLNEIECFDNKSDISKANNIPLYIKYSPYNTNYKVVINKQQLPKGIDYKYIQSEEKLFQSAMGISVIGMYENDNTIEIVLHPGWLFHYSFRKGDYQWNNRNW